MATDSIASVTLANVPSKHDTGSPPDGLLWGDGELSSQRRAAANGGSPDVKGVFGEGASVVAVPPAPPAAQPGGRDAVADLFARDQRLPAPALAVENDNEIEASNTGFGAKNRGLWNTPEPEVATQPRLAGPRSPGGLPRAVTGAAASMSAPKLAQARTPVEAPSPGGTRSLEFEDAPNTLELESEPPAATLPSSAAAQPHPAERASFAAARAAASQRAVAARNSLPQRAARSSSPASTPATRSSVPAAHSKRARPLIASDIPGRRRISATTWLLATCGLLVASIVGLFAGAQAGFWPLPPAAMAMIGRDHVVARTLPQTPAHPAAAAAKPTPAAAPTAQTPTAAQPAAADTAREAIVAPPTAAASPAPLPNEPVAPTLAVAAEPVAAKPVAAEPVAAAAPAEAEPVAAKPVAAKPVAAKPPAKPVAAAPATPTVAAATPAEPQPAQSSAGATPNDNSKLLQSARAKHEADDLVGAEALLRRGLASDPSDHHLAEELVRVLIDRGRGPEAVKYAIEIVHKRPKRVSYRLLEGDARLLTGDKPGAERAWREALAVEPDNKDAKRRLGIR
jgi:hypothetical protein